MVAGKSGSFELTGTKGLSVRVFWSEEYSFDDNQSVVSINNIQITSSLDSGVTYYPTGKVTVDGQTVVEFNSFQGTHRVDLIKRGQYENIVANKGYPGSPWKTGIIDHDTDGTKSVTIALEFSCASINGGTGSGCSVSDSVSVELTAIPRASSITKVTDTVLGNICEVAWTPASASFYYRLKFIPIKPQNSLIVATLFLWKWQIRFLIPAQARWPWSCTPILTKMPLCRLVLRPMRTSW